MSISSQKLAEIKASLLNIPSIAFALFLGAFGAIWFAAFASQSVMQTWKTKSDLKVQTASGLIKVNKRPLSNIDLQQLIEIMKANHPNLEISALPAPGSLAITASRPELYRDWMAALGTVQGASRPGSVWLATDLCVGDCNGVTMRAEIQGIVQSVEKGS